MSAPQTRQRPGQAGRYQDRRGIVAIGALYRAAGASQLPLAPYGREIMDALTKGQALNLRLYACRPDPWARALVNRACRGAATTLVLPLDADPLALRWPPVSDLVANVTGLPGDTMRRLAQALVRDGVRLAYLIDGDNGNRSVRVVAKRGAP